MDEINSIQRYIMWSLREDKNDAMKLHSTLATVEKRLSAFGQQYGAALNFCVKPRTFEENVAIWDAANANRLDEIISCKRRVDMEKSESAAQFIAALLVRAKAAAWEVQLVRTNTHFIVADEKQPIKESLAWYMFFIWSNPPHEYFMAAHIQRAYTSMMHEL